LKAEDLYGLSLEEFVEARNALVRELKKRGESDQAESVRQLRKPSVPVWAVNQLARTEGRKISELVKAEDALRSAHGRSEDRFREALAAERATAAELLKAAGAILVEAGRPPTEDTLERIGSTLQAAAADPAHREELTQGRLTEELEPLGFEALAGVKLPARASAGSRAPRSQPRKQPAEARAAAAAKAKDEASRLERDADRAERAARDARRRADRARAEAERLANQLRPD
jgi:hypothetical protein